MSESTMNYKVVFNNEEQFSIWPAHKNVPKGWTEEGTVGEKSECLEHIERIWTDMRPLSLRLKLSSK
ncbi:MbtH family protein [Salibacterium sp. K-3]